MKVSQITLSPDPYEPFRLAQGFRVGDLLFVSGKPELTSRARSSGTISPHTGCAGV
jgi:2-iminobutanoate/2-iminopropanoate deaminase